LESTSIGFGSDWSSTSSSVCCCDCGWSKTLSTFNRMIVFATRTRYCLEVVYYSFFKKKKRKKEKKKKKKKKKKKTEKKMQKHVNRMRNMR